MLIFPYELPDQLLDALDEYFGEVNHRRRVPQARQREYVCE